MTKKDDTYNVPGLEKGLQFIELLASEEDGLTLQDIIHSVDATLTTAYRILSTLSRMGYVTYNEKNKTYILTRKILSLGYKRVGEHDLMEYLLPAIRSLRDKVKESVFYGVLGEEKGVFIEQAQGMHHFKFILSPGATFELHPSAPGKALMAFLPLEIRNHYLDKITYTPYTPHTITTRTKYLKELELVKEQGYATDLEETLIGVICIGAPVFNYDGIPVGAIWVSGPSSRITEEDKEHIVVHLLETTQRLSHKLGYITK